MRIDCPIHGLGEGIEVSPELAEAIDNQKTAFATEIVYFLDGDECLSLLLSDQQIEAEGVVARRISLPMAYPTWHSSLMPRCELCARDLLVFRP